MSTLSTLRANTRTDLKIDPNGDIWSSDTIDRFINRGLARIYGRLNLDFKETSATLTLTASTATYNLGSLLANYDELQSILLAGRYQVLSKRNLEELQEAGWNLAQTGEPLYYYFYGDKTIGLYPVPDGNITSATVRYERTAPTLTSSDEPAFDTEWHYILELYARWQCLASVPGHEETAKEAERQYKLEEAKCIEDLVQRDNAGYSMAISQTVTWPS